MGNCQSGRSGNTSGDGNARRLNNQVEKRIREMNKAEEKIHKLLLLGTGESGKSTIFKQIKLLYKDGFSVEEKKSWKPLIHENIFQAIKGLLDGRMQFEVESENSAFSLSSENEVRAKEILSLIHSKEVKGEEDGEEGEGGEEGRSFEGNYVLSNYLATLIHEIWNDDAIKKCFERCNELQLPGGTEYYLKNIFRIANEDYIPSDEDVLYARMKTTSIVAMEFKPPGAKKDEKFQIFDVGGQRNERRKWIHLFDHVTAVIFCVALNEYDQVLLEDESMNRMDEARNVLASLLTKPGFEEVSFLVLLNKFDLFEKRILKSPLNSCEWFSDYIPSNSNQVEHAYNYAVSKFERLYEECTGPKNVVRVFRTFKCTAVNTESVSQTFTLLENEIFNLVKNADQRKNLISAGLLPSNSPMVI